MRTICKNCKFHTHIIRNLAASEVWYNHFCSASPLPESVDVVSGEKTYLAINSFGQPYSSDVPYNFCKDINDGNCPMFESA